MKKLKKLTQINENNVYAFASDAWCSCAAPCGCSDDFTGSNSLFKSLNDAHSSIDYSGNN